MITTSFGDYVIRGGYRAQVGDSPFHAPVTRGPKPKSRLRPSTLNLQRMATL